MFTLGQKLKWPKACAKRLYKHTRVVRWKKALEKTPNIREMRRFLKSAILQRLKPLQNGQSGSKIKMAKKTCAKRLYKKTKVVPCKKPLEKKIKYSRNETIFKIGHLAEAMVHAMAIAFEKCSV